MKRLRRILIIDGYNVINAWDELKKLAEEQLELARERLNSMISEYTQYSGFNTIIVYDAYRVKNSESRQEKIKNLEIIFTKENETADTYIERFITDLGPKKFLDITVATDDISEQNIVAGKGGNRISTRQLYIDVINAKVKIDSKVQQTKISKKNTLEDFISDDIAKILETPTLKSTSMVQPYLCMIFDILLFT